MSDTLRLGIDLVLIVLLAGCLGWGIVLHRRLSAFRTDRDAFTAAIAQFDAAAADAQKGLVAMREQAAAEALGLRAAVDAAAEMRADLDAMTEHAAGLAERLSRLTGPRLVDFPATAPEPAPAAAPAAAPPAAAAVVAPPTPGPAVKLADFANLR